MIVLLILEDYFAYVAGTTPTARKRHRDHKQRVRRMPRGCGTSLKNSLGLGRIRSCTIVGDHDDPKILKVLIMLIHRLHVSIMEFSQATLHAGGEERHSKMKLSSLTSYPMRMSVSWSSVCI